MKNDEYREFLQDSMPLLHLRWLKFRRVRKQVYKRLSDRVATLGLKDLEQYRAYIETHKEEWQVLDFLCRITISRFYRDREVFDTLRNRILPSVMRKSRMDRDTEILCWSAGCCCGEEAYTMQILWKLGLMHDEGATPPLKVVATDTDEDVLIRARRGCYPASSLRDLPEELKRAAFIRQGDSFRIRDEFRQDITFANQDIRKNMPERDFHIILCRNFVLTYYDEFLQRDIVEKIFQHLLPKGYFVTGKHEILPKSLTNPVPYEKRLGIYVKAKL